MPAKSWQRTVPQLTSFNEIIAEVEHYKKCASAVLQALAKCNGQPLPELPFDSDKQVSAKIKELREQISAIKLLVRPAPKPKNSKKDKTDKDSKGE